MTELEIIAFAIIKKISDNLFKSNKYFSWCNFVSKERRIFCLY